MFKIYDYYFAPPPIVYKTWSNRTPILIKLIFPQTLFQKTNKRSSYYMVFSHCTYNVNAIFALSTIYCNIISTNNGTHQMFNVKLY